MRHAEQTQFQVWARAGRRTRFLGTLASEDTAASLLACLNQHVYLLCNPRGAIDTIPAGSSDRFVLAWGTVTMQQKGRARFSATARADAWYTESRRVDPINVSGLFSDSSPQN